LKRQDRHHEQDGDGQAPVQVEHERERKGDEEDKVDQMRKTKSQKLAEDLDVAGKAGHEVARLGFIVVGKGKSLELLVKPVAQKIDGVGAKDVAQISPAILKNAAQERDGNHGESKPRELVVMSFNQHPVDDPL